jgi:hypothetical protein
VRPNGTVATEFAPFPEQFADFSYGVAQNVTTNTLLFASSPATLLIPANGTLGSTWTQTGFNDSAWTSGRTGIGYETAVPGFAVLNFLANVAVDSLTAAEGVISNPSQQTAVYSENAAVINYFNTGGSSHYGNEATFPGFTIGADANDFVIEATATITIPSAGNWTFGVNSDDGFGLTIGGFSMSYPTPRGPGDTLQTFSFPAAGLYPLRLVFYERGGGSEVELFAAQGSLGGWDSTNFRLVGDTANGGLTVTAPVVSGGGAASYRPFINLDVQSQMNGVNGTAYIRVPFTVANPALLQSLTLGIRYDDGFITYLNGQEVARRNAPASPQWNSTATAAHPNFQAVVVENVNISDRLSTLQAGNNVLAIQGLNQTAGDTDFLIQPELVDYQISNTNIQFFSTGTPGAPNGAGYIAFVEDTKFSVDRGFYNTPFSLSITSGTPSATIRYTTNGSTPSLTNGLTYSTPITITNTTVIRAAAFKTGFFPSDVDTHTYIFVNDVIRQSSNGAPPAGWPSSWGANVVDYGMDPDVVNNPAYSSEITNDLKTIPTYAIVTDLPNLFDPATGIYANAGQDGAAWERPASVELIYPDGTEGFQINAGIRIRGGYSRSPNNPKHAFRLFFRTEYGAGKLNYPVFEKQNGVDSFDAFDLRTFQNYSWSFEGDARCIGLRDQFSRDTQLAQGQPAERGDFCHLYINGQYWGIFNTCERPEASFGESYFGGVKEDYDVIKVETSAGYTILATDGNLAAWTRLWQAATNGFTSDADYFKVQGLNVDGTPNPAYENLLDVDNLIDHMLVIFFGGNLDAPISNFLGNNNPNNFYGVRNRTGLYGGFRFMAHDSEHTLRQDGGELNRDRTGPFAAGDPLQQGDAGALARSNPQYIFSRLTANAEFRLRFADHVQKQFFNGGVLTTEACRTRFLARSNEIYGAIVAESARWGDSKVATPRTRNVDWVTQMNLVYGTYFGQRPGIVLGQFQTKGWFPSVTAPSFNQFGGNVSRGFQVTMTAPAGTIYYTLNGSDPRLRGGGISASALVYSGPITLNQSRHIKARVLSGGVWSALTEAPFYIIQNFTGLLVTEIMYHPPGTTNYDGDEFEFIELKNVASTNLELSGIQFNNGINYTFPIGTFLAPGQFLVLVHNATAFTSKYPAVPVGGVYTNNLSNGGETVTLVHVSGAPIFSVDYGTRPPWPVTADGAGFSVVSANPNLNPNPDDPLNWRASSTVGGSPGADDISLNIPRVLINEALTHTDLPTVDQIELYNPNPTNVSIGNWYLTDQRTVPQKFRIPVADPRATIAPGSYVVFTEDDWNANPTSSNSFRLDSHGEEIYLFSADAGGNLTGYSDGFAFGSAQNGVTFGRHVISTGEAQYPAQKTNSLGGTNVGPRVGPIVITEIHYHPAIGGDEFIEVKSITNGPTKLYDPAFPTNTWKLNGAGFSFPMSVEVPAAGLALIVNSDPSAFRTKYSVPAGVPIFGPFPGALQDSGENLALQRPDAPDPDTNTGAIFIPYIDVDVVRYNDKAPWPTNADGFGPSLERLDAAAYGNDPINWRASPGPPSPGVDNTGNRQPAVNAGQDRFLAGTNFPLGLSLAGFASDDGFPSGTLSIFWSQMSGPGTVWFGNTNQTNTTVSFPGVGTYVLRLTANDGALQSIDDLTVTISRSTSPVTFVSKASVWKYLDNGSDQGTAWRALLFNDGGWNSGPAPLGYGDANGQWPATTNTFGPNANNKYITTYYRRAFTVADPASVTNLLVSAQRDDGVVVYLNGTGIFTNNMPASFNYLTLATGTVGTTDETTFYSQSVNPALLLAGTNVLASEIHQVTTNSTDIIFDLELSGVAFPSNTGPSANAGADKTITLPASVTLSGTVGDDGLPIPPGLLTFGWTKVSGPGTVTFANSNALSTTASFSAGGNYVLRLTANDGALTASDDIGVTVNGSAQPPFRIDSVTYSSTPSPLVRLRFIATAGQTYTAQYRNSLSTGTWLNLTNIPAQGVTQPMDVTDTGMTNSATRSYRIVSPQQP